MSERQNSQRAPVFLDASGRRWRTVRRTISMVGVFSTMVALYLCVGIIVPPLLPSWVLPVTSSGVPATAQSTLHRATLAARQRARHTFMAALRPRSEGKVQAVNTLHVPRVLTHGKPIAAAFYVNWDDDAFRSLEAHAAQIDWLIGEWGFMRTSDLRLETHIDSRVRSVLDTLPASVRPRLLSMITNVDSGGASFSGARIARLLDSGPSRARFVNDVATMVHTNHLGGVVIDFEQVPEASVHAMSMLLDTLRARLHPEGAVVAATIASEASAETVREWSNATDMLIPMLYDEHSSTDEPGPVASQQWYQHMAERFVKLVPADHLLIAFGTFGYDWTDAVPRHDAEPMSYTDVMRAAREHHVTPMWDAASYQPLVTWTDADSTDHVLWYLDAVTNWNALRTTSAMGVAGHALWRLGAEDPSLWHVFGRGSRPDNWSALTEQPAGYGIAIEGEGELLRVTAHPSVGERTLRHDGALHLITSERSDRLPTSWTVERTGDAYPHRVALTFDDGPDEHWTPAILDTLRSRHVQASFFVIGEQVQANLALTRRIVAEGHTLGNHTFSHPDLSRVSPFTTQLELDATARLLEAVVGSRTALFRPPYFGDAEPTTVAELAPVEEATKLGYLTAGVHVDSDDWRRPGTDAIIARTLRARARGHVILLHDGGGDRAQTVASIGPLIDSLRARGDTIVPLGALAGLTAAQVMPSLDHDGQQRRWISLAGYTAVGAIRWFVVTALSAGIVLGCGRLLVLLALAIRHRYRRAESPVTFAPGVSVIVPAYNEEAVVVATVRSLLAQVYAGTLEVIVVDDGSPDNTFTVVSQTFADEVRVRAFTTANGGKATALNFGLSHARHDIIVALDADTVFEPTTIAALVSPLSDARVGAVAGNAKVGNRLNLVTRWQALEYITSQNLDRRAFASWNAITVVPGAVGAWRRNALIEAGGFSHDTLAEDQDMTISLRRAGWRIAYADNAIAWTEAPDTLRSLARQRFRWCFGTLQCAWKHRDTLFRSKFGALGWVAMPNTWLFQVLFVMLSPLADALFVVSLVRVWLIGQAHGATYAQQDLVRLLSLYAIYMLIDIGVGLAAVWLEPGEDSRLAWLVVLQRFAYRQVMYVVVLKAIAAALRGRLVGWGSLERKATVIPGTLVAALALMVVLGAEKLPAQSSANGKSVAALSLSDLPITEVPGTAGSTLAVFWSGDGGWAELVKEVSTDLAASGMSVVGINSRSWLNSAKRTPDDVARDTERVLRYYLARWNRTRIVLLGYSRGSGFLPFIVTRLPADLRARIDLVGVMGAENTASFEFHFADIFRSTNRATDLPVIPELLRMGGMRTLCIYGTTEDDTICPKLTREQAIVVARVGDHHFDRNYPAIAQNIRSALTEPWPPR